MTRKESHVFFLASARVSHNEIGCEMDLPRMILGNERGHGGLLFLPILKINPAVLASEQTLQK